MIIQCKQCRTKFRFDDAHMQGNGIWLRCSRCGHVYFQENPLTKQREMDSLLQQEAEPELKPAPREENIAVPEHVSKSAEETPSVFHRDEKGMQSLNKIMQSRRRLHEEKETVEEETRTDDVAEDIEITEPADKMKTTEKPVAIQDAKKAETKKRASSKGAGKAWKIALWSVLVILIIPALIYFYALPQYGEQLVMGGEYLVKKFNEYRGVSEPVTSGTFINQMVKLQEVRYRRVENYILGQIGVLEGTAVNSADFPLSRIQVKGNIVDSYAVILDERISYAGNILTDEELTNLSEEEMMSKLTLPGGLNNSNDKILPGGRIPFMVVFPKEPVGVIKTTVMTVGAERLL